MLWLRLQLFYLQCSGALHFQWCMILILDGMWVSLFHMITIFTIMWELDLLHRCTTRTRCTRCTCTRCSVRTRCIRCTTRIRCTRCTARTRCRRCTARARCTRCTRCTWCRRCTARTRCTMWMYNRNYWWQWNTAAAAAILITDKRQTHTQHSNTTLKLSIDIQNSI